MSIQKNQEYIVDIIDNGFEGEGIAKIDNFTIFIPGTIKGEKVRVLIVKVLSSHGFGKVIEILEKSQARQDVDCNTYKRCGGCNLRHVKYEETLKMKQNAVQSLVNKTLKNKYFVFINLYLMVIRAVNCLTRTLTLTGKTATFIWRSI